MKTTRSKDGTEIAYDVVGSGPPIVLADGAFCGRTFGPMPDVAKLLADRFTVLHYDRRGRGGSGDSAPYDITREIEDLAAVCERAEGSPCLYGISSGAALALRAVGSGLGVRKLAIYEPPFALDGSHKPDPPDFREQIAKMLAAGKRDDAVKLFMKVVGVPAFGVFFMRLMPSVWPKLRDVAHTLPYDFAALGDTQSGGPLPEDLRNTMHAITAPTLVLVGGKSPRWMRHACDAVAQAVPGAVSRVVDGQNHTVAPKAISTVLADFFSSSRPS
jgi:pimeloyl-ACP methyl ester carboxylesterase